MQNSKSSLGALTLGAIGVVYGDIGTSVLYSVKEVFGSGYVPLAFQQSNHLPQVSARPGASAPNRFYMYGVIARLAMLAASYELEATNPDAEIYD